jgi:hypothetical protein
MNTGNTKPIAHRRGKNTFLKMPDYPFRERIRRGPYYTVVELAVKRGVPNIINYVVSVDSMISDGAVTTVLENIFASGAS